MKQMKVALRTIVVGALAACLTGVMAVSAQAAVTKTGYKYC